MSASEANASIVKSESHDPVSLLTRHDSITRHQSTNDVQPSTTSAGGSRLPGHRPAPLILPPVLKSNYSYSQHSYQPRHSDTPDSDNGSSRERDVASTSQTPGSASSERSAKRPRPSEFTNNDNDSCRLRETGIMDLGATVKRPSTTAVSTPMTAYSDEMHCLCLKPARIKRPRNVFILYRQHTQAQVIAEYPGISNPRISQIIGERWKALSKEEKEPWVRLSEEEKARHGEMYPDYKYQPKRWRKNRDRWDDEDSYASVPGRCGQCGRRNVAPLPSSHAIASAERPFRAPASPTAPLRSDSVDTKTLVGSGPNGRYSSAAMPGLPSPAFPPRPHVQNGNYRAQSGHPGACHSSPRSFSSGAIRTGDGPASMAPEEKRRRIDSPATYYPCCPSNAAVDGNRYAPYSLPHRPRYYNDPCLPPRIPHSATLPRFSSATAASSPVSPWASRRPQPLLPPVLPPGHSHPAHFPAMGERSATRPGYSTDMRSGYEPLTAVPRLPPYHSHDGRNYYKIAKPESPDKITPSTAMAGLALDHRAEHSPMPPSFAAREADPGPSPLSARSRLVYPVQRDTPARRYPEESVELPPLMIDRPHSPPSTARPSYRDPASATTDDRASPVFRERLASSGRLPTSLPPAQGSGPDNSLGPRDVMAYTPTPTTLSPFDRAYGNGFERGESEARSAQRAAVTAAATASQVSRTEEVRTLVQSIPYLGKLEALQRICPPRPLWPRRGPIIAIEGHNVALRELVGRAVERALVQISELNVSVWTMCPSDSSGSDEDKGLAPGSELRGSLSFSVNSIFDCIQLAAVWHKRSNAAFQHVTSATAPRPSRREDSTRNISRPATPPPPPAAASKRGCSSPSPSPPETNSPRSGGADSTPRNDTGAAASHSASSMSTTHSSPAAAPQAQPPRGPLPVALLATGYSLAVSDKCAISVSIGDSYAPVDHWEYMAMMWRSIPGPDLVVYADATSPPPSCSNVRTVEQRGVIIVHLPAHDGSMQAGIDQKTERRLAFELMEFVRTGNFGVPKGI